MKTLLQTLFFFLLVTPICFGQGSWTKIGDMPEIRAAHTADEINGKVYIAGGANTEQGAYPTTMLVYDRDSSTWTTIPLPINSARLQQTSCVVDSNLYLIGGVILVGGILNSTSEMYMFKPNTGEWILKNPMPTDRNTPASALLDGKIYVAGGLHVINGVPDYNGLKTFEVYDLSTETWSVLPDMPTYRWGLSAVAFNGKIYILGGRSLGVPYSSIEVYDPQMNTWTTITTSSMPTPRYQLTTCLLNNKIYAIDGWYNSSGGPIYNNVEVYDPITDNWTTYNPMPVAVAMLDGYALDGKIYMYGGSYTTHPCIGTSAIYELSPDDIFALQPYVDKSYAIVDVDSVLFRTRFSNIYNHSFTPYLIHANLDSTYLDSLTLYDDGLHGDSLTNDGLYGGYIPPRQYEDFFILNVSIIDNQTNKYYNNPDRCRFTTAGAVVLDSISITKVFNYFSVKPFIKNQSTVTSITNASVSLICNDSWITSITPTTKPLANIPPGATISPSTGFTVRVDSSFSDYFNFKVDVMSDGWTYWRDSLQIIVAVEEEFYEIPTEFSLAQNYPNPFNPSTKIKYSLPQTSQVQIKVFDVLGKEIETLVNEEKSVGTYEINWNAATQPSGVYFYQLKAGEFISTKKMILIK